MKILVIGASGFVGSHIVQVLIDKGINCVALEHKTKVKLNCKTIQGSLEDLPYEEIIKNDFSHIIHAARISGKNIHERFFGSLKAQKANQKLLDFIEENIPSIKLTFVSGSLNYGDCGDSPVFETQKLNPTAFAREYALAELPIIETFSESRLQIQICRPAWIIGNDSWFKQFYLNPIFQKKHVLNYSDKNPNMNLIEINDCARLITKIAMHENAGIFNLSSPIQLTKTDFLKELSQYFNVRIKPLPFWKKWLMDASLKEAFEASILLSSQQNSVAHFDFKHSSLNSILKNLNKKKALNILD